jgi:hypothetical protein
LRELSAAAESTSKRRCRAAPGGHAGSYVGGGSGLFSIGCALLGLRSILVDDLAEIEQAGDLDATLALLDEYGVELRRANLLRDPLDFDQLDAVTLFHVIEHLPASPKGLLHRLRNALRLAPAA